MSPGSARLVPAVDDVQTGRLLDETAADLALRATRYLRTRFRERVTIGDLSAHLAYSPSHLTRVFTSVVGTSPMDYLAAWRLQEAKHLLITHRLGVAETCHEVGYSSVGTFNRRFLRDVGTQPGALRRIADRIAERTLPAVSLLVPAEGRIRIRLDIPEEMRRTLGPAPYQWVGTFPRPSPVGCQPAALCADISTRSSCPWSQAPPGSSPPSSPTAPTFTSSSPPQVPSSRACVSLTSPSPAPSPCRCAPLSPGIPRFSWPWRRWWSDGRLRWPEKGAAQESRIGVVRCVPVGLPSWNVKLSLDMQLDTQRSH